MKEYWLALHQDTFLWVKGNKGLVYNALNHRMFRFNDNEELRRLIDVLQQMDSLYRVVINERDLSNEEVRNWVNNIVQTDSGVLIENDGMNERPVSLKPELKVQDAIHTFEWEHKENVGGRIMTNLHRLVLHINGSQFGNSSYSKQIIHPEPKRNELNMEDVCRFITSFGDTSSLSQICLVGCLWQYAQYEELLAFIHSLNINVTVYCIEKDFLAYRNTSKNSFYDNVTFHVLISDYEAEHSAWLGETAADDSVSYGFLVTTEDELDAASQLMERYELSDRSRIYPLYNADNLDFLKENLYMREEYFEDIDLSKREVFAHQVVNTNFFGTLTVFSDGKVYSGSGTNPIGTIKENLYTLVYREMTEGNSWMQTRSKEPCASCVYQLLCPSPSTYEQIIGVPNLCHINQ